MSMYNLASSIKPQNPFSGEKKNNNLITAIIILAAGIVLGGLLFGQEFFAKQFNWQAAKELNQPKETSTIAPKTEYAPQTTQEEAVIAVVKNYSPAVVSIVITKDMPIYERYYSAPSDMFDPFGFWPEFQMPQVRQKGTKKQEVGAGTGFIVSEDGLMITNKHVVSDKNAEYTVIMADGSKYSAKVLALDPVQDLAVVKISAGAEQKFPAVKLGDSANLQIGQTVIAIGNTLGEFDNTVSVGVISGLRRSITASGGGTSETLDNLIQTDAAINEGNSGGPLLNLKGEVIGVNTAVASGAENVGFVLPINYAKRDIDQVKNSGKISYPYLGIYYTIINKEIQKENELPVDYGAWIASPGATQKGKMIAPVIAGSPARTAGLKDQDIVLEINGEKITQSNNLAQIIAKYNVGDKIKLKVLRAEKETEVEVVLGDRSESQ